MSAALQSRRVPDVWRVTILGAAASLPAAAVLNWLPNSGATVGGAVLVIGAPIAGAVAATRSVDPGAAGLRAGVLAGVAATLAAIVTDAPTATWSPSRVAFFVVAAVTMLCLVPAFGWVLGRVGGRVATRVGSG